MASLTHLEKRLFENLFGMSDGYVMGKDVFSNRTFADFFKDLDVNIYDDKYATNGESKANRLRSFWTHEPDLLVGKVLSELLSVWVFNSADKSKAQSDHTYLEAKKTASRLIGEKPKSEITEAEFLRKDFSGISVKKLKMEAALVPIIENRIKEASHCLQHGASLAAVILTGSILEGILLGAALNAPQKFNQSNASPKDKDGKVLPFDRWTLGSFIDVAYDVGALKLDVKKFSYPVRDFRNFIHPYEHMASKFTPDEHTAEICLQVLKAAIADLSGERKER